MKPKPPFPVLNRSHPLAQGLVGAWAFYEGSGDKLYDLSGNGHDGTLTNMDPATDWVAGQYGWALDFDGSDDAVSMGDVLRFDRFDPFSLVVIQQAAVVSPSTVQNIINKSQPADPFRGYSLNTQGNIAGDPYRFTHTNHGGDLIRVDFPRSNDLLRHVVVVTYDGSSTAAGVKGYEDGQAKTITVQADSLTNTTLSDEPLRLAKSSFAGRLHFAAIYNRALSPAEVGQLYHDPFAMYRRQRAWVGVTLENPTGTGAVTSGAVTSAASGTFTAPVYTGTGEVATGGVTTAATGDTTAVGSGSLTVGAATASASGDVVGFVGTGSVAVGAATASASGDTTAVGSGAVSVGPTTVVASGTASTQEFTGAAAVSAGAATLAASGVFSLAEFNPQGEIFARPLLTGTIYALD